jgi:hypothetical protein
LSAEDVWDDAPATWSGDQRATFLRMHGLDWSEAIANAMEKARDGVSEKCVAVFISTSEHELSERSRKVFESDAFESSMRGFVVLDMRWPREFDSDDEAEAIQSFLCKYRITHLPSLLFMDSGGRTYGLIEGGLDVEKLPGLLKRLSEAKKKRDDFLAEAARSGGLRRASAIDNAIDSIRGVCCPVGYDGEHEALIEADPHDELGVRGKYVLPGSVSVIAFALKSIREMRDEDMYVEPMITLAMQDIHLLQICMPKTTEKPLYKKMLNVLMVLCRAYSESNEDIHLAMLAGRVDPVRFVAGIFAEEGGSLSFDDPEEVEDQE